MNNSLIPSDALNANDHISKLPNDVLVKILSRLSTNESVKTSTLSTRWVHVWKGVPHLHFDMREIPRTTTLLYDVGTLITKVINDHCVDLEKCTIRHETFQCDAMMIETWLQALVHTKHVKDLTLENEPISTIIALPPNSFSAPSLESVKLSNYNLKAPYGFNNCNLKHLNLMSVLADLEVYNKMLSSCPSLESVRLKINCLKRSGPLKIENPKLKFVLLECLSLDKIELSAVSVDTLVVVAVSCQKENLVIANPNLQFNRNFWATGSCFSHTSYNISRPPQGEKSVGHEFMTSRSGADSMNTYASLSVSVDLMNTKEVDILKEVLVAWPGEMQELEIMFKNNNALEEEEGESSIAGTQNMFLGEPNPFPNFRVYFIWLSNFSGSAKEFALASYFITQGMVIRVMLIKPSSTCPSKKLEIEAAVANLKALPKGHETLSICMFS